jgi:hypothetical protein
MFTFIIRKLQTKLKIFPNIYKTLNFWGVTKEITKLIITK